MRRSRQGVDSAAPHGFIRGADIDLSGSTVGTLAIDVEGRVHCIIGYRSEDQPYDLPYYAPSVALRDKDGRNSHRFVGLAGGVVGLTWFFEDDKYYRVLDDQWLALPRGSDPYFGVVLKGSRKEDLEHTRNLFGASRREIESVAVALARFSGRRTYVEASTPRVTFSRTQNNRCDLSGCLIPSNFPYIAFEGSQYDWGHVSLYGFYRLLAFMCPDQAHSPIYNALLDFGADEEALGVIVRVQTTNARPIPYER